MLGVEMLQERDAPLASRAGAEALGDKGYDWRVFSSQERTDLAQGNVEAQAHVVIGVHGVIQGAPERAGRASVGQEARQQACVR